MRWTQIHMSEGMFLPLFCDYIVSYSQFIAFCLGVQKGHSELCTEVEAIKLDEKYDASALIIQSRKCFVVIR